MTFLIQQAKLAFLIFALIILSGCIPSKPTIIKSGTVQLDIVEASPFVFNGKLYWVEWMRAGNYLRIVDRESGKEISRLGYKHAFPCVFVEGGIVYVVGTKLNRASGGNTLTIFTSKNITTWSEKVIFDNPDYVLFNTSLAKTKDGYVMSIEVNNLSKEAPASFAARFLESKDLKSWRLLPRVYSHGYDRYTAPHCLRWVNGWYYLFYLEAGKPTGYEQFITRSRDLINWEYSLLNPVLAASSQDKYIKNNFLTVQDVEKISNAENINNSDIDFIYFNDRLMISYSWGNQSGAEFLAQAEYLGSEKVFLESWFLNVKSTEN